MALEPPTPKSEPLEPPSAVPSASPGQAWRLPWLLLLLVGVFWTTCLRTPAVWQVTGIGDTSIPFLDLYALLAAGETDRAGGNPYQPSMLDPYHRPHVYSTWWLVTGSAGLTRADNPWLGWTLAGLTLLAAVAYLRPRNRREFIHSALVLGSPALLMNLQRGNNDLVIFIFLTVTLLAWRTSRQAVRLAGAVLLAIAAVLKYYPLAAVVVLLQARTRREFWSAAGLVGLTLALAVPGLLPGLASAAKYKPHPDGLFAFGAPTLFRDFGLSAAAWIVPAALLVAWAVWRAFRHHGSEPATASTPSPQEGEFMCGAAVIVGCFFLGASYLYKLIFAVWLLPWLWRETAGDRRRGAPLLGWLLLACLWLEGLLAVFINLVATPLSKAFALRLLDVTLAAGQLAAWTLVACLLHYLAAYLHRQVRRLLALSPSAG